MSVKIYFSDLAPLELLVANKQEGENLKAYAESLGLVAEILDK